jgi:hypothetical protein
MLGKRKRKRKTRGGCAQHYLINQYYSLGNKIVEDFCQTLIFFFFLLLLTASIRDQEIWRAGTQKEALDFKGKLNNMI